MVFEQKLVGKFAIIIFNFEFAMSRINITNIVFEHDTTLFQAPINMQITFDVIRQLDDEIEWSLIYIGSPDNNQYDQVLENFSMPPLGQGTMEFKLTSQGPNYMLIPTKEDLFGATAIILSVKYRRQEFFRVGYYVYNTYMEPELIENEPTEVLIDRVYRQINVNNPRITRFNIDWDSQLLQLYAPPVQTNQQFMFTQALQQQQQQQNQQQFIFQDLTNYQQGQPFLEKNYPLQTDHSMQNVF